MLTAGLCEIQAVAHYVLDGCGELSQVFEAGADPCHRFKRRFSGHGNLHAIAISLYMSREGGSLFCRSSSCCRARQTDRVESPMLQTCSALRGGVARAPMQQGTHDVAMAWLTNVGRPETHGLGP